MVGIYVYNITTIYVLVKFVTRPYDGKKLFLVLYLVNDFFHAFQLVAKLSSITRGSGRGKFAGGM